jgi:teichuronic acid exporter
MILQLIVAVAIGKSLNQGDYGFYAAAMIFVNLGLVLRDFGLAPTIIKEAKLTSKKLNSALLFVLIFSFAITSLLLISSNYLASLVQIEAAAGFIVALAYIFPFSSISSLQRALFERHRQFYFVAKVDVLATAIATITAITLLFLTKSAFALVVQLYVYQIVASMLFIARSPWKWALGFDNSFLWNNWKFGSNNLFFALSIYVLRNADTFIVGRFLGSVELAAFAFATRFTTIPTRNISAAIGKVVYSKLARIRRGSEVFGRDYEEILINIYTIFWLPVSLGIAFFPWISESIFDDWTSIRFYFATLPIICFAQLLTSISGPVLNSADRSDVLRSLGIFGVPILTTVNLVGVQFGQIGFIMTLLLSSVGWMFFVIWRVANIVDIDFQNLLKRLLFGFGIQVILVYISIIDEFMPLVLSAGISLWIAVNLGELRKIIRFIMRMLQKTTET